MNDNIVEPYPGKSNLTVIKLEDAEKMHAKLINFKKTETKEKIGLPPQPESYIKAKKHDFL
jgi:hypothetical protein